VNRNLDDYITPHAALTQRLEFLPSNRENIWKAMYI
jgi:hypothetical protein